MDTLISQNGLLRVEDVYYLSAQRGDIKFLDASYGVVAGRLSPKEAFFERHIDGAQFFDIDDIADPAAPLPHTIPSAAAFGQKIGALGISNQDHVVIYDQSGGYMASSRAWWMFRTFGHERVYVLERGLGAWVLAGFPTKRGEATPPMPAAFTANLQQDLLLTKEDVLNNLQTRAYTLLDARPRERFSCGHIPKSINLPFGAVLEHDGAIKPPPYIDTLLDSMAGEHWDTSLPAATCGSGVTACTLALALYGAGHKRVPVYDGSWSEWGAPDANTPIERAPQTLE